MKINWKKPPYEHESHAKNLDSIMNPGSKVTLPQLISEWIIENREKYLKNHPRIRRGSGWSVPISRQVRNLCQQAVVLCNYFPNIKDDPIVLIAFKRYFTENLIFKIGQYRKHRLKQNGGSNVTQDEKDVIKGLVAEYNECKEQFRRIHKNKTMEPKRKPKSFGKPRRGSSRLSKLMEAEK